jgi:hypothetical protein
MGDHGKVSMEVVVTLDLKKQNVKNAESKYMERDSGSSAGLCESKFKK